MSAHRVNPQSDAIACKPTPEVYPKVRIRDQDTDDQERDREDFCTVYDSCFSGNDHQEDSRVFVAKVPKAYLSSIVKFPTSIPEGAERKSRIDKEEKQNSIVCPIPILRPRAVVSSPENDTMVGNRNKTNTARRSTAVKNHNPIQTRHSRLDTSQSQSQSHISRLEKSDNGNHKIKVSTNKGSVKAISSQQKVSKTGKSKLLDTTGV